MAKFKSFFLFLVLAAAAILTASLLYKSVTPLGALKLDMNSDEVKQRVAIFLENMNLENELSNLGTSLRLNEDLVVRTYDLFGTSKGNNLLRNKLPGFYWEINWIADSTEHIFIGAGASTEEDVKAIIFKKLHVRYDTHGSLIYFNKQIKDSSDIYDASFEQAMETARKFITKNTLLKPVGNDTISALIPDNSNISSARSDFITDYKLSINQKVERNEGASYEFLWKGYSSLLKTPIDLRINVAGSEVTRFEIDYPEVKDIADIRNNIIYAVPQIAFFILIFIMIGIFAYKQIKAYEISFRMAMLISFIVGISFALDLYLQINQLSGFQFYIPLVLGTILYGGGIFLVWSVSEALAREVWKEKFISLDLATNGYFMHSRVGRSFFTGLSGGLGLTIAWLLLLALVQQFGHLSFVSNDNAQWAQFDSSNPVIAVFVKNIYNSIFIITAFFIFLFSGLRKKIHSTSLIIIITLVIWTLVVNNEIRPWQYSKFVELFIGLILILIYFKYDVLATIVAYISFDIIKVGIALFTVGNIAYLQSGYLFIGLVAIICIGGFMSLIIKDKITDYDSVTPAFVKNITERQRLQRELEIARDVQMSFLPKTSPDFTGLDIAARCLPANEVGGDYYDFVELGNNRLGIIVGDVSGKGTQAAFYMTLTKGFLKALSKTTDSPSEMLTKMNELFYENVERGTFISMVYGIFDITNNKFKIARAGHNPVIVKNPKAGSSELLNPTGLALGLEKGKLFGKTIREEEIEIESGDVFVFYTDGFTEAMNKKNEEFGEDKLIETIETYSDESSGNILLKTFKEVEKFVGKAQRHDDMTIVVVKVK